LCAAQGTAFARLTPKVYAYLEEVFVAVKKTKKRNVRPARLTRSKKRAVRAASNYAWVTSSRAIVSGMICIVVMAALLTAREEAPRGDADDPLSSAAMTVADDTSRTVPVTATAAAKASPAAASEPSAPSLVQAVEMERQPEPVAEPQAESPSVVTITGCLERDEGTFRLTDASGVDAPTARSWKSGFIKKRTAQIDLADAVGTLSLRNHVGRRVAATGTLIDRELRAHSMRFVGACD
jgi:hypothetical protein